VQRVEGNVTRFERLGLVDGLSEAQVLSLFQDSEEFLWVGPHGGGLARLDRQTGEFAVYRHTEDPQSLSSDNVYAWDARPSDRSLTGGAERTEDPGEPLPERPQSGRDLV
jgi:hypothetical protein